MFLWGQTVYSSFTTSHPYLVADFWEELITYREMQFIIAETDLRTNAGGTQVGRDALMNGIKASFERLGLSSTDYENYMTQPNVLPDVGNLTIDLVMTQKYLALFL